MSVAKRTVLMSTVFCLSGLATNIDSSAGPVAVTFENEALRSGAKTMTIRGVLSKPKGEGPFPAVVLLSNCGGPARYEFAKFWPKYLNQLGYVTINVDSFTPRRAKRCSKTFKPDLRSVAQDAFGALSHLTGLAFVDKDRIGVFGSSLGAHVINAFVGLGNLNSDGITFKAAVSLYPVNCRKVVPNPGMIPTLIVQGDKERGSRSCRRLPRGRLLSVNILPNTYHGFDQPSATRRKNGRLRTDIAGNKRLYSQSATRKAQSLVKEFLAVGLAATPTTLQTQPAETPRLAKVGGKDPYRAVGKRDSDGDGRVSASEWEKSTTVFSKIDRNGDGFLTPQEFFDHWQRRLQ